MKHFIRAVEVQSFPSEKRHQVVNLCTSLIRQHEILKDAGKSVSRQIEPIEEFFKAVAEFPELISRYPRFRNVCRYKIDEITEKLNSKNMPIPNIIEDMPAILKLLENRSDYVRDAPLPTPTHSYNLRPRK
jgi:hypothetical protein